MSKPAVIITTIYPEADAIQSYSRKGYQVVLIGDKKTPEYKSKTNIHFYSLTDQRKLFPKFSRELPLNHYSRKNLGYLIGMKEASEIIETDDDSFPYSFFPNFVNEEITVESIASNGLFVNTFSLFSSRRSDIWPRGYPLRFIKEQLETKKSKISARFPLQQSLIDKDSDVDAIYRLTNNREITFVKNKKFALSPHTYAPLNTQNTYWMKEAFLLMYVPCFVSGRITDIYRGYIAQRLLWEMGYSALFLSPSVYQIRNPHDYIKDFKDEISLYTAIEDFVAILEKTKLTGSVENKMLQLYKDLVKNMFFPKEELVTLGLWLDATEKLLS